VSKLLVAVQTELIQELAIQHIDFDALVQSEGCRYFLAQFDLAVDVAKVA
jgi:hypothetical protein